MRVIILGGGFGGMSAAIQLAHKLDQREHEVVVISDTLYFLFRPSLIWVPFDERKIKDISFSLEDSLNKSGVMFVEDKVQQLLPHQNRVILQKNKDMDYDFLVIATGAFPDFEKVEGLEGNTSSVFFAVDALKTRDCINRIKHGDPIVIGVAQGNPNPWIAYEFLFELDSEQILSVYQRTLIMKMG